MLARSNVVLEGYWEQPEESERALADGWFHTGDGGVIGDDGYLTIQDRKKDVIITGGENVSLDRGRGRAVLPPGRRRGRGDRRPEREVGRDDQGARGARRGRGGHRGRADRAGARSKAAGYKAPTSVEFRDELARTATGKLQKFKLRAPYWEGYERQVN